ncbi:MAG: cytochrome c3 family protein [Nitrospiraceae bacterium]|nr:cytochrome c3 family protein [Nitrospiraceae bacterium]
MKKTLILVVIVLLVSSAAFAKIAGSKHDLTSSVYYTSTAAKSACQFCHTPHHAAAGVAAPLWNRANSTATYALYASNSGGNTLSGSTIAQPGANSMTCLSCHDGTMNLGDVLNGPSDTITATNTLVISAGKLVGGGGYIGTDLTTTHPIGVVYDTAKTKAGLNSTIAADGSTINNKNWRIYGGGNATGRVECGSCHDPHMTDAGKTPFLKDTLNSICTDCHSNK